MATIATSKRPMGQIASDPDTNTYSGRVAARIRKLREDRGLSVSQFADKLLALRDKALATDATLNRLSVAASIKADSNRSMQARINHYESGRADLPLDLLPVWSHLLKVTIHELLPPK